MTAFNKNKLWGCITSSETVERLSHYPHFFANEDHCLVIADEQPAGTVEMTEEFLHLFVEDDWGWINSVLTKVRKEQLEKYPEEAELLEKQDQEFLERFKAELTKWRNENGGNA